MRKVHIKAEVVVLVPVTVRLDILANADDDANLSEMVLRWAKRKQFTKATVEDVQVTGTLKIGEFGIELDVDQTEMTEALEGATHHIVNGTEPVKLLAHEVMDSR